MHASNTPKMTSNELRDSAFAPKTPRMTPGAAASTNGTALRTSTRRRRRYASVPLQALAQTTASEKAVTVRGAQLGKSNAITETMMKPPPTPSIVPTAPTQKPNANMPST